jgi:hypothetical protein
MGDDWLDDPDAEAWARHVVDELVPMVQGSAVTISLVPTGDTDVKFAVELGVSIMLDKPIILIVSPGMRIPAKLAQVADEIVEVGDLLSQAGARQVRAAVARVIGGK